MICAILLGRKGSVGFPGKNTTPILGRMLSEYPLLAALNTRGVDQVYLSTDDEKLMDLAKKHRVNIIERPSYLATKEALGEDAYHHAYLEIKKRNPNVNIDYLVLLFCNAPTFLPRHVEEGIDILNRDPSIDSAVTVSQYNWYSPIRARRLTEEGFLQPFIPFENYGSTIKINCDRDAQGDVYFADVCVSVVRPRCFENLASGLLPQRWMGRKIAPIMNWGGLDVDREWQMPLAEYWLRANGFTEEKIPY